MDDLLHLDPRYQLKFLLQTFKVPCCHIDSPPAVTITTLMILQHHACKGHESSQTAATFHLEHPLIKATFLKPVLESTPASYQFNKVCVSAIPFHGHTENREMEGNREKWREEEGGGEEGG